MCSWTSSLGFPGSISLTLSWLYVHPPPPTRSRPFQLQTAREGRFLTQTCVRLQSKTVYSLTIGALYHTVELNSADQCCTTLNMLCEHPGVARHVQKLAVRQGSRSQSKNVSSSPLRGFSYAIRSHVCTAVKRAAARLDALQSFVWGGEDYPLEDDIWFVLRQSCVSFPFPSSFPSRVLNVWWWGTCNQPPYSQSHSYTSTPTDVPS